MASSVAAVPTRAGRPRPQFHPLRVAEVERLTEDAVAITFEVPEHLAEQYAFRPGQSLTLRREESGASPAGAVCPGVRSFGPIG